MEGQLLEAMQIAGSRFNLFIGASVHLCLTRIQFFVQCEQPRLVCSFQPLAANMILGQQQLIDQVEGHKRTLAPITGYLILKMTLFVGIY
jgi:hypothetical protein